MHVERHGQDRRARVKRRRNVRVGIDGTMPPRALAGHDLASDVISEAQVA